MALPFHTVDTVEEAEQVQTTYCKLQYPALNTISGEIISRYVLNEWSGEVEDVMTLADKLELD
jgi:hypothetical protein